MKCPFCGFNNIAGSDECESCLADLTSLDGLAKKAQRNEFIHKVLDQPLSSLNPRPAVCVRPSATLAEVVRLMNEIKSGCILVDKGQGKLAGILTERDLLFNIPANWNALDTLTVGDIMKTNVEALRTENSLNQALHQMSVRRYRHIVVYNSEGDPEVVSSRDLFKYLSSYLNIKSPKLQAPASKSETKKSLKKKPIKKTSAKKTVKSKKLRTKKSVKKKLKKSKQTKKKK